MQTLLSHGKDFTNYIHTNFVIRLPATEELQITFILWRSGLFLQMPNNKNIYELDI